MKGIGGPRAHQPDKDRTTKPPKMKKKKKKGIEGKELYIKKGDGKWKRLLESYPTFTADMTMTYPDEPTEPVLTIQVIGNTITIDYQP